MQGVYIATLDKYETTQATFICLDAIKRKIIAYLGDNVRAIYTSKINQIS